MKIPTNRKENEYLNIKIDYNKPRKAVYAYLTREEVTKEDGYSVVKFEPFETCNFNLNLCEMPRLNTKRLEAIDDAIYKRINEILPLFLAENKTEIVRILKECV